MGWEIILTGQGQIPGGAILGKCGSEMLIDKGLRDSLFEAALPELSGKDHPPRKETRSLLEAASVMSKSIQGGLTGS